MSQGGIGWIPCVYQVGSGGFRVCIRVDIRWVLCEPGWDQVDSV